MNTGLVLWIVWGVFVLFFIAVKIYTARLNRDEDDTLFLDETFAAEKKEQDEIIEKVKKVQPLQRTALWLLLAMSLVVVVYYVFDAIHQFSTT